MEKGKISVVISTYNRKTFIDTAIASVLMQTYKNYEILICDDCSTDGTYEYVQEKYKDNDKVKFHRNEHNMGLGENRRNIVPKMVSGEYVVFLDDDDKFLTNDYFEKAVALFEKYGNLSIVACNHYVHDTMNDTRTPFDLGYEEIIDNREFFLNFGSEKFRKPIASDTIFSMKALEDSHYTDMKILIDTTLFLRTLTQGPAGFVREYCLEYLVHGGNMSFNCSLAFILDNLNEKMKIYRQLDDLCDFDFNNEEKAKWLADQLDITIIYYIRGSLPNYIDFVKLLIWYKKNVNNKEKMKEFKRVYKEAKKKGKQI